MSRPFASEINCGTLSPIMEEGDGVKKVCIVYYSGTGGAERAARSLGRGFDDGGCLVDLVSLRGAPREYNAPYDLLVLVYAVHACNAPLPVYQWLQKQQPVQSVPAVVISVSGGGAVTPNTACRQSTIRRLRAKGYTVIYEDMIVMPSNWIVATPKPVARQLLALLPQRTETIVRAVLARQRQRMKPILIDRFFSWVGELEKTGARHFGKGIRVSGECGGCGWCRDHCPAENIGLRDGVPIFGSRCQLCLSCIYGCPKKALYPSVGRFVVIPSGYDLKALEAEPVSGEEIDLDERIPGYIWSGVRRYIRETHADKCE